MSLKPYDKDIARYEIKPGDPAVHVYFRPGFSNCEGNVVHLTTEDLEKILSAPAGNVTGLADHEVRWVECFNSDQPCLHIQEPLAIGEDSGVIIPRAHLEAFRNALKAPKRVNPLADVKPYDKDIHHFSASKDNSRVYVVFQKGLTNCKGNAVCFTHDDLQRIMQGSYRETIQGLTDQEIDCIQGLSGGDILYFDIVPAKGDNIQTFNLHRTEVERFLELTKPKVEQCRNVTPADPVKHDVATALKSVRVADVDVTQIHQNCLGGVVLHAKTFLLSGEARVVLTPSELLALHAALTGQKLVSESEVTTLRAIADSGKRDTETLLVERNESRREVERLNGELSKLRTSLDDARNAVEVNARAARENGAARDRVQHQLDNISAAYQRLRIDSENVSQQLLEKTAAYKTAFYEGQQDAINHGPTNITKLTRKQKSEITRAYLAEFLKDAERNLQSALGERAKVLTMQICAVKSVLVFPEAK